MIDMTKVTPDFINELSFIQNLEIALNGNVKFDEGQKRSLSIRLLKISQLLIDISNEVDISDIMSKPIISLELIKAKSSIVKIIELMKMEIYYGDKRSNEN